LPVDLAAQCTDVSGQTGVSRSGYRLNRRGNVFVQTVTLRNNGANAIQAPVRLTLQGLPATVTLENATTTSSCPGTTGAPIVEIAAPNNSLAPGESLSVVLNFSNPTMSAISYTPVVYAGSIALQVLGNVVLSPDGIYVNQQTTVQVRAAVPYNPALGVPTVTLERTDASANFLASEGSLFDNGNLNGAGDEIQGDGVFSNRRAFLSQVVGPIYLRVKVVQGAVTNYTPLFTLQVFDHLTLTEFNDIQSTIDNAYQTYLALLQKVSPAEAKQQLIQLLLADPDVAQAGLSGNSNSIWIVFKEGILGGVYLVPTGQRGGGAGLTPLAGGVSGPGIAAMAGATNPFAAPENRVKSRKALVLGPYTNIDPAFTPDETIAINTMLTNSQCPKYEVTYRTTAAVNVESFKNLHNYGIVVIATHGDTFYEGILSLWQPVFGWNFWGAQVTMLTGHKSSAANYPTYETDLKKGRMAIVGGVIGNTYAVLPSFIQHYSGAMPNSIVYIGACRSTYNTTMANAFLGKGAGTYFGYTEYVDGAFATQTGTNFFTEFVTNGKSTGDAFVPGLNDGLAYFTMHGANDLKRPTADLENGGFESGNLGAWSGSGDARVITQLGNWTPQEGSFVGIISTGLGFTVSSGAVSQNTCMDPGTKKIEFKWNYSSEEFLEWCNSIYQDYFRLELIPQGGGAVTLFNRRVIDLCGQVSPAGYSFDRGGVYTTGWRSESIDISGIVSANPGKNIMVRFSAGDVGDSIYDTAILIDDVKLTQ
jgi:hypothetical protein